MNLQEYHSKLRTTYPKKCQQCECLQLTFRYGEWFYECLEVACYRVEKPIVESQKSKEGTP
jgi:hypothetical protein